MTPAISDRHERAGQQSEWRNRAIEEAAQQRLASRVRRIRDHSQTAAVERRIAVMATCVVLRAMC